MLKNLPRNQPGEPGGHAIPIANIRSLISELQEYGNNWPGKRSNEQDMVIKTSWLQEELAERDDRKRKLCVVCLIM